MIHCRKVLLRLLIKPFTKLKDKVATVASFVTRVKKIHSWKYLELANLSFKRRIIRIGCVQLFQLCMQPLPDIIGVFQFGINIFQFFIESLDQIYIFMNLRITKGGFMLRLFCFQ